MSILQQIYRVNLSLLTDLYQLTMACGYWRLARADDQAVFHLIYRQHPFAGGFTVAAGLAHAVDFLQGLRFDEADARYLATLRGNDGEPLFDSGFLNALRELTWTCDIDAVPEGTVVFPHAPLVRVRGPLWQCQLLETPLLNLINYQTLIATKAARVCLAAGGDDVLEFGLRRAQGIDGALAASRAAYIGGCSATSHVLAGRLFGIPVKGTHAHSWIMSFVDEAEAFAAYAQALPNNCVFLVDTYDTLEGVRRAIAAGRMLRERGFEMAGIRLDSGDLAYLSIVARKMLDEAGFPDAVIVASNDLDENIITSLKDQGARIAVWGVGTRLVTGHPDAALGGVYKLGAVRRAGGNWEYKVKVSEQAAKVSAPGVLQVRRYRENGRFVADMIYDELQPVPAHPVIVHPIDPTQRKAIPPKATGEDLLVPILRHGRCVYTVPALAESRKRTADQLAGLHAGVKRFVHPHAYPAGLERGLHELKTKLILEARGMPE